MFNIPLDKLIFGLIIGALVVALAGAGYGAVSHYVGAIRSEVTTKVELGKAKDDLLSSEQRLERIQEMLDEADKLAKESERQLQLERASAARLLSAYDALSKSDPEAAKVLDTRIPDSVRGLRRDARNQNKGGGSLQHSDSPSGTNTRPATK